MHKFNGGGGVDASQLEMFNEIKRKYRRMCALGLRYRYLCTIFQQTHGVDLNKSTVRLALGKCNPSL